MRRLSLVVGFALVAGCSTSPCDRNAQVSLATHAGDCGDVGTTLLGDQAACAAGLSSCPAADQQALQTALECLAKLPTCAAATRAVWDSAREACVSPLRSLGAGCAQAFFAQGVPGLPGSEPDAGLWAPTDGGEGVDLIGVADEHSVALAWSARQPGAVATWALTRHDGAGARVDSSLPGATLTTRIADAGGPWRYFVAGLDSQQALAWGVVDGGGSSADAGPVGCRTHLECADIEVCDQGQCREQVCASGSHTCPEGFLCLDLHCKRVSDDAGTFIAPVSSDAGAAPSAPLPFISTELTLTPGPLSPSPARPLGGFPARNVDVAALDSARVVTVAEQEGLVVAHVSRRRGVDLEDEARTTAVVDTIGRAPHVTWNPDSQVVFTCYTVGRGVRVRRSTDEGRSWGVPSATIEPPAEDGGLTTAMKDCNLAPWTQGGALLTYVTPTGLAVRTVAPDLTLGPQETVFLSGTPATNNVFDPVHPAIATLPSAQMVHITYTASRQLPSQVIDADVFGSYRDATLGAFTPPRFLKPGFGANPAGTSQPQDWTAVAIDPVSQRALAAYASVEGGPGGTQVSTVYVSLWNPQLKSWGTGSDLTVFVLDSRDNVTSLLFPQKGLADVWDAFSPGLTALPSGRLWLTFLAGPRPQVLGDYRLYAVGFDFQAVSPVSNGAGWFVRPVRPLSDVRVSTPAGMGVVPGATRAAVTSDGQLSLHAVFVEGLGAHGETDGRGQYVTLP